MTFDLGHVTSLDLFDDGLVEVGVWVVQQPHPEVGAGAGGQGEAQAGLNQRLRDDEFLLIEIEFCWLRV